VGGVDQPEAESEVGLIGRLAEPDCFLDVDHEALKSFHD
jgi:hypothetical protein